MQTKRKLRVFLSHLSEDTPTVQDLYEKLKSDGFLPWMDRMDLTPGEDWDIAIAKALSESDVILVCLSRASYQKEGGIQSEYRRIANLASEKPSGAIFTIPVRLEECNIPDPFRQIQHLDYFSADGHDRLIQSLRIRSEQLGTFAPPMQYRLDQIKEIEDQQKRAKALVDFARQSSDSETIGEILLETRNFTNVLAKVVVLRELAQYMQPGTDTLLQEALSIEEETARASVLAALPHHLNDKLKAQALAATFEIKDKYIRVQTLAAFLPHLDKSQKNQVLRDAFLTMREISDETLRVTALAELAPHLDDELKTQAFAVAHEIKDEFTRVHALSVILPYLPYQEKAKGLREAFEVMQGIADENRRANALIELSPRLDDELKIQALDIVRNFKDKSVRTRALSALSPHLSDEIKAKISEDNLSAEITQSPPLEIINIVRPYDVERSAVEKRVATDKPIQSVKQDKLDFKIYVNALHSFILSKYTTTPITISIDGVWGTGKSSLMSMLRGKLDPQRDGVRKLYEWFAVLLPWWRWYFGFLKSSIAKWFGKTVISLFVRNDVDEDGIYLYFGQNNKRFHKYISDIVEGFSIDPEVLNQTDNEKMEERIRKWAMVHANCEPMQPLYHYAVWLNAWKFDNQEEVWASLALATMEQIKQKHGLLWRLRFWLELTFSRSSFAVALWQVVKQILLPLLYGVLLVSYELIINSYGDTPLKAFEQVGGPLLWGGLILSGILKVSDLFKDPFQIELEKVFDRPNYKDKVKFLSHFEKDFARIVRAATKNGFGWKRSKLVIFIDDLDRCEPPKSADIVEAVNLFLDAEGCVFVIGMDSESVSKSVEVKYKDLFERMKAENTGVVSLGRSFLDKIVQIPFSVPRATSDQITHMVEDSIGFNLRSSWDSNVQKIESIKSDMEKTEAEDAQNAADKSQEANVPPATVEPIPNIAAPRIDPASYAKPAVQAAILAGTKLLSDNPRQVKTFINLFRLSIYIANERGILEEKITAEQTSGLNLEKLAMWTACSVRWQSLVRHFHTDAQIDSLRVFLYSASQAISPAFVWQESATIPEVLKLNYKNARVEEKGSDAHWCYLPWEWWLLEPDFLKTIKSLQNLWRPKSTDENDWLEVLLTMTRPISAAGSVEVKR